MKDENSGKISRVLSLYTKLINGETINKADAVNLYGVNERSIQRDISDIRYYRYAVKYGMDDLNDVNELANKYPEVRPMINRKQKIELENE